MWVIQCVRSKMFASKDSGVLPTLSQIDDALIFETRIAADVKLTGYFNDWLTRYPSHNLKDFTYTVVRAEDFVVSNVMES